MENENALKDENEFRSYEPSASNSSGDQTTRVMINTSLNGDKVVQQRIGKPQQRIVLACHFIFKILGTSLYLFSSIAGVNYIATFVFVLIFLSMDFWIVKNLSGRLLAGLRWWSVPVDDDQGSSKTVWRFEAWTPQDQELAHPSQIKMFWIGIFGQQLIWTLLLLTALFTFKLGWFVITIIASCLNGSNLYGYIRCKFARKNDGWSGMTAAAGSGLFSRFGEAFTAMFKRKEREGYVNADTF